MPRAVVAGDPVLDWAGAYAAGRAIVGGKGWNLARLDRYGFPVPRGVVVRTVAYEAVMAHARRTSGDACERLARVGEDEVNDDTVVADLDSVRRAILMSPLPASVVAAVDDALGQTLRDGLAVAVRSSVADEDGHDASFAGIYESILAVRDRPSLHTALLQCYASAWTPRALAYRKRSARAAEEAAVAVVICEMVPARASGVVFSCDPRTGDRDVVSIAATRGLADAVLRGSADADEYTCRLRGLELSIEERPVRTAPALDAREVLELARLAKRVEAALGAGQEPQDVEWVHDGQRFVVVQARPVTGLNPTPIRDLSDQPTFWSSGSFRDAFPGVQSPLGWSLTAPLLSSFLFAAFAVTGYRVPRGIQPFRLVAGRPYFNMAALQWIFADAFGILPAEFNHVIGGSQPEIRLPANRHESAVARMKRRARGGRLLARGVAAARAVAAEGSGRSAKGETTALGRLDARSGIELGDAMLAVSRRVERFGRRSQLANSLAGAYFALLVRAIERWVPGSGPRLAVALLAGSGGGSNGACGQRLRELGHLASADPAVAVALDELARGADAGRAAEDWRARFPTDAAFTVAFEAFLRDYGHRGVYELEIANPRWGEDPSYLLQNIRALMRQPESDSPAAAISAAARREIRERLRRRPLRRAVIALLVRRAHAGSALREDAKSTAVRLAAPLRSLALEIGRRLADAGSLARHEDIFYCSWWEIDAYLRDSCAPPSGLRQLVADRREIEERDLAAFTPAVVWEERPRAAPPISPPASSGVPRYSRGAVELAGLGASAGYAEGAARLLRHPREGARLRPGDIIIAPSTDPGWTPLFLRAAGLVTEVGGHLSHGSVVAREFGLPAVVNVAGVMEAIRDGERITIDGTTGRVRAHQPRRETVDAADVIHSHL
jgi:rifampicin phosphotransferase